MQFQYLVDKIKTATFEGSPFPHIHINNFFSDAHFSQILCSAEVEIPRVESDQQLFAALFDCGYKIIEFPGCITDRNTYIKWHRHKSRKENYTNTSCEGFGVTLRLISPHSSIITELREFMSSREFLETLAAKFGIDFGAVVADTGVQKYLDGYEISPHPDTRNKALTYMVNINPGAESEKRDHHTHYLKFREEFRYIQSYWDAHPTEDRCWVPWDWCVSQKVQRENNSIVIFAPRNDTIHAVKATYNHLSGQRTQMYGNLWYRDTQVTPGPEWENFVIQRPVAREKITDRLKSFVPPRVKDLVRAKKDVDAHVLIRRLK